MSRQYSRENSHVSMGKRLQRGTSTGNQKRPSQASLESIKKFFLGRRSSSKYNSDPLNGELPVDRARDIIMSLVSAKPELYDARDVSRLGKDGDLVSRYLEERDTGKLSPEQLVDTVVKATDKCLQ